MKIDHLYGAVLALVLIAIMLGVGLTVLGNVDRTTRTDAIKYNDSITASNTSCTALSSSYITTSTALFYNGTTLTQVYNTSCFTWDVTGDRAGSCVTLNKNSCSDRYNGQKVNLSYTYGASSFASTALGSSVTAIGGFATWFAVIVVIIAAAIIIGIVIKSFRGN